jgi:ABC-type uncharacterized transport system ATPase subunit
MTFQGREHVPERRHRNANTVDGQLADAMKIESLRNKPSMSSKIVEKKSRIEDAAAIIGISPSGVRLLLNTEKWAITSQEKDE